MRQTLSPTGGHPKAAPAASPVPGPLQTAGRRSGEGSASVLEYLVQDRIRASDRYAPERGRRP